MHAYFYHEAAVRLFSKFSAEWAFVACLPGEGPWEAWTCAQDKSEQPFIFLLKINL